MEIFRKIFKNRAIRATVWMFQLKNLLTIPVCAHIGIYTEITAINGSKKWRGI